MPRTPRPPTEPTDDWRQLQLRLKWPQQRIYELIRPVVVWGRSATQRAAETHTPRRTLAHKATRFDTQSMLSLFATPPDAQDPSWRALPRPMQQVIVDLRAQYAGFHPNEMATICYVQFGRRPSAPTIQRVLAEGPPPARATRRLPRYHDIHDPAARRFALLRLHAPRARSSHAPHTIALPAVPLTCRPHQAHTGAQALDILRLRPVAQQAGEDRITGFR